MYIGMHEPGMYRLYCSETSGGAGNLVTQWEVLIIQLEGRTTYTNGRAGYKINEESIKGQTV